MISCVHAKLLQLCLTVIPWTVAHQAPLFMGFSRQEYWSGLPFPSPGDLLGPGIKPASLTLEADALTSEPPEKEVCMQTCRVKSSKCVHFSDCPSTNVASGV